MEQLNLDRERRKHKLDFDFALLKMRKKVDLGNYPHIRPICLPSNDENSYKGQTAIATGWGETEIAPGNSDELLKVNLLILSNEDCNENYKWSRNVTDQMLCTMADQKAICIGDSG